MTQLDVTIKTRDGVCPLRCLHQTKQRALGLP